MHRFGHEAHDVAVMLFEVAVTGSDVDNRLPESFLREIAIRLKP